MSAAQLGLWATGTDEDDTGRDGARLPTGPDVRPVNDLDALERVQAEALDPGYLLVGSSERVARRVGGDHRGLAVWVDDTVSRLVHQCLASGALTRGGYHVVRVEGRSCEARSVLVPDATRKRARRWAALRPIDGRADR